MSDDDHESRPVQSPKLRFRMPKVIRNTLISAFILLVLIIAAGVIYIYESDQQPVKSTPARPATASSYKPIKAVKPAANAPEGVALDSLTSPVAVGSEASMDITTNPGSKCTIVLMVKNVPSPSLVLKPQIADVYGSVSWNWTVTQTEPLGTWPLKVTCVYNKRSGVFESNLTVTEPTKG